MNISPRPAGYYREHKGWGWYHKESELATLVRFCHTAAKAKALEIGAFDGVSANSMLDILFPHPDSEVHTIDLYAPDPTTPEVTHATSSLFAENCRLGGHVNRIFLYEGMSAEVLGWMLASEGFWQSFDFIYIDGSHLCSDVFIDAGMCWHLAKPGGIIAFDDYNWMPHLPSSARPRAAIDAFAHCFSGLIAPLACDTQYIFRKLHGPLP